ncbi:MAG: (d)CMP kinase, partial [Tidjanibacter sp.]|nr:(d)CMP kinase [Tidjanibacter sp.]
QQRMGRNKGVVMDGRDIGTVVFPDAELKIFMTADPEVRAERRYKELVAKGDEVTMEEVMANIVARDNDDINRAISPLRQAEDALVLDNSRMTLEEELEWFDNHYEAVINR